MTVEVFVAAATVGAMIASGSSLVVSLKINASQAKFETRLMRDLDERFMKVKDCAAYEGMRKEMEYSYRASTKSTIEDIQVEVRRDKDDLNIQLKGILAAIERKKG